MNPCCKGDSTKLKNSHFRMYCNLLFIFQTQKINFMKNLLLLMISILVFSFIIPGCNSNEEKEGTQADKDSTTINASTSPIDGSWELVWSNQGGNIKAPGKPIQFKMFHDGFFSLIMQDSAGNWNIAGAGTFETNGNTYKETFKYVTVPEYVGLSNSQEFELKGDTLYFRLFKKVENAKGEDISKQFPTNLEEKRVRALR